MTPSAAELWVIDAVKLATRIHRDPTSTGYGSIRDLPPDQPLVPVLGAALSVTLGELELN